MKLRLGSFGVDGQQKGVDLRIGLDLVAHTRNDAADVFFLSLATKTLPRRSRRHMVHGVQVIVLAVPNPDDHPHGVSRHLLRAADELVTLSPSKVDSTVMREDVIRQGPTVLEIEMAMPVEPWEDEIDTAPHVGAFPAEDDERQQLQAGIREELNGWLDEMAWDDI